MRAAIAVRVSPRPQENVRYSPEIQEQTCRDWAAAHGHEVVTVVRDILVSGGSSSRFDSIFAAIEQHTPDLFVVSDLSRWTRDKPSRFWAIKALLEDQGVQLVSVAEPWLGNEQPFSDTVTTAQVEMNYQERLRLKAKTSQGVRKAWASGKRWGHPFGWTWHPREAHDHEGEACSTYGVWTQDVERITAFYRDWIEGVSAREMAYRYGMRETNIRRKIASVAQRDVIPADLWLRAQEVRTDRAPRYDSQRSSIYRGLLSCPFCGSVLQQATHWGHYKCRHFKTTPHQWATLSARQWVTPEVRRVLGLLREPERASPSVLAAPQAKRRNVAQERDRLSMAWVKGRLSDERYEAALAELDAEERRHTTPKVEEGVLLELVRDLSVIDLEDRDPETGNPANQLLRGIIERIDIKEDRSVTVVLKDGLEGWVHHS